MTESRREKSFTTPALFLRLKYTAVPTSTLIGTTAPTEMPTITPIPESEWDQRDDGCLDNVLNTNQVVVCNPLPLCTCTLRHSVHSNSPHSLHSCTSVHMHYQRSLASILGIFWHSMDGNSRSNNSYSWWRDCSHRDMCMIHLPMSHQHTRLH